MLYDCRHGEFEVHVSQFFLRFHSMVSYNVFYQIAGIDNDLANHFRLGNFLDVTFFCDGRCWFVLGAGLRYTFSK